MNCQKSLTENIYYTNKLHTPSNTDISVWKQMLVAVCTTSKTLYFRALKRSRDLESGKG